MSNSTVEPSSNINANQVVGFLQQHPDFFIGRDDLLAQMILPHQKGSAISLVERQLKLFRDRDENRQRRFDYLVDTARENERRFESLRKITLSLLECRDIEQAFEAIVDSLTHDFQIEFHHLLLFIKTPKGLPVRNESKDVVESMLGEVISSRAFCGKLLDKQVSFLFGEHAPEVNSIALAPLDFPERIGLLVLGSRDEKQFRANVGTLFIRYLGDLLSRHLAHLIKLSIRKNRVLSKKKK
ncbi:MAG: DUF484 family protein [Endozoicomonas sp. (ex Botrylloides leachii)]|nr:DUF484 family protein [Endozoicomonas sp. (ex Botrylloides leachii)]